MKEIVILIIAGLGALLTAFIGGKRSEKHKQENEKHKNALKIVREAKERSRKRRNDDITAVKRRLRKNARDR